MNQNKMAIKSKKYGILGLFLFVAILTFVNFTGSAQKEIEGCEKEKDKSKILQCWDNLVGETIKNEGIERALDRVAEFYNIADSPYECHDLMHKVGASTYELFASGKDFSVSPKTSYCSFGFYHGFMETLVARTGDPKEARRFCDYVDSQGKKNGIIFTMAACYHGIGHGWTINHDENIKEPRKIVAPALELCERIVENQAERTACATGVFDALSLAYYTQQIPINKEDPLWLCREQPEKYKKACYLDSMPAVLWLGGYDLATAAPFVEKIEEDLYASEAIRALSNASMGYIVKKSDDYSDSVKKCHNLQARLYVPCIKGLADGITQFSHPEEEEERSIKFCKMDILSENEKNICFETIFSHFSTKYPREKILGICGMLEEKDKMFCPLEGVK